MRITPITILTKRHDPIAIVKKAALVASEEMIGLKATDDTLLKVIETEVNALRSFLEYVHDADVATGQISPPYHPNFDTELSKLRAAGLTRTADFMHKWTSYQGRNNLMKDGLLFKLFLPTQVTKLAKKTKDSKPVLEHKSKVKRKS